MMIYQCLHPYRLVVIACQNHLVVLMHLLYKQELINKGNTMSLMVRNRGSLMLNMQASSL